MNGCCTGNNRCWTMSCIYIDAYGKNWALCLGSLLCLVCSPSALQSFLGLSVIAPPHSMAAGTCKHWSEKSVLSAPHPFSLRPDQLRAEKGVLQWWHGVRRLLRSALCSLPVSLWDSELLKCAVGFVIFVLPVGSGIRLKVSSPRHFLPANCMAIAQHMCWAARNPACWETYYKDSMKWRCQKASCC